MQGAVAVVVRRADIVLPLDDLDVLLPLEHLGHAVHIVDIAAHDAHARDVVHAFPRRLDRQRQSLFAQLRGDAGGGLDAAFDVVDGVARVEDAELAVEHLELECELLDGGFIEVVHELKVMRVFIEGRLPFDLIHVHPSVPVIYPDYTTDGGIFPADARVFCAPGCPLGRNVVHCCHQEQRRYAKWNR